MTSPSTGRTLRRAPFPPVLLALFLLAAPASAADKSVCHGTTSNGSLENGCKLPAYGPNFSAYSVVGRALGRTYVHCTVAEIVAAAYAEMAETHPEVRFIYGETGLEEGGPFEPHKTHQNGLSVDFFVPVRNEDGESVALSTHMFNKWGYDLELDGAGRLDDLVIDFEAMAAHIAALHRAARARGVDLWRVIFDPELQPFLRSTAAWPEISGTVQFSTRRSWVRHDERYHVDFAVPCEPR